MSVSDDGVQVKLANVQWIEHGGIAQPDDWKRLGYAGACAVMRAVKRYIDWRVLGGVIPGPIPVEWVKVGDTIQDHGVTGVVTSIVDHIDVIQIGLGSGHVLFAKVKRHDWIHVTGTNHTDGSAT